MEKEPLGYRHDAACERRAVSARLRHPGTVQRPARRQVDLPDKLAGDVLDPLRNKQTLKVFRVNPEMEIIVWENGAELAPEFL
jgi:hypothetical protein